jgi:hypothetical protein
MKNIARLLFLSFILSLSPLAFPTQASAFGSGPWYYAWFSKIWKKEVALDGNGNPIRDANGNPVYNEYSEWDPPGLPSDPVTRLGLDVSYNPSEVQILTDPSTYGFLCEFATDGSCPNNPSDPFIPRPGQPYGGSGTTWSFIIDNQAGRAILSADFSNNPVPINGHTYFFSFATQWSDPKYLLQDPAIQNPRSPNQYCKTVSLEGTDLHCGEPIPEPSSSLSLLALGTLGAASTLKRKLKPSQSTEKETTKVG